ncbi:MAG: SulP family inorganic anion transporter, partial [Gammaproteobacteria bacterium]|nr:SulP family inorganic anion transporter [Gammaproteobacteria bacterium]
IVIAGVLQVVLGWLKAGRWAAFFPAAVAHGMLAAIGLIIIARQIHTLIGTRPDFETPLQSFAHLPHSLLHLNPEILLVGGIGLTILFAWPLLGNRGLGRLPAPLLVVLTGYLLGRVFDLNQAELYLSSQGEESDLLHRHVYVTATQFLTDIPGRLLDSVTYPDFSKVRTGAFWTVVASLFFIGSLESLLAASAVDRLDPEKRRSDLNRDIRAIGIGNVVSGLIGGMPMIAEIVRSSANIGYGARSSWSNFFHGLFLLSFIALVPHLISNVPLASLAALLIYAGYRLASPRAFANSLEVGGEQLALFVITLAGILATNILAGVAIAILVKLLIHRWRGVSLRNLFELSYRITRETGDVYRIKINGAAIFSNFIVLKSELAEIPAGGTLVFDLTYASLVDHTVMDFIDRYRRDYIARGGHCEVRGLDRYEPYSGHPLAARRRKALPMRRQHGE